MIETPRRLQHLRADRIAPPPIGYAAFKGLEKDPKKERIIEVNYLVGDIRHLRDYTLEPT